MKRLCIALVVALLPFAVGVTSHATQSRLRFVTPVSVGGGGTNPIAAARQPAGNASTPNTVWAATGAYAGVIPSSGWSRCTTGTGTSTISAYTGTAGTINTAISGCDANHYVELGSGTFTLSSCVQLGKNSVVIRGQGADATKLIINGGCTAPGHFLEAAIRVSTSTGNYGCSADCGGSGPQNSATWTLGYTQGATSITLGGHTNLTVGSTIWLDQLNDSSDGYPATGDLYECDDDEPCAWEGGNAWARDGRTHVEGHTVVSCGTSTPGAACTGNSIVIDPGLISPDYRSGQTPGAWWADASTELHGAGVENLSLDYTGTGTSVSGVFFINCTDCWMKGLRVIFAGDGNQTFSFNCINCLRVSVLNNYFFGTICPDYAIGGCNIQYTLSPQLATMLRVEGNIIHQTVSAIASNDPEVGSVYGYNYVDHAYYSPGPQDHNAGDLLNLWEGNNVGAFFNDNIHGTHFFLTYFRNHVDGTAQNDAGVSSYGCFVFWAHNRFHNAVGNVCGSSAFTTYQYSETTDSFDGVFALGFKGSHGASGPGIADDARTRTTFYRWGNWDNVTSSNDNGSNDTTGIKWSSSEVPSGITNYSQAEPSDHTLPASLYLSAKPAWFQSITWPPIGPDVSNGNLTTTTGGHANKIPARVCFESLSNDGVYGSSYAPNSQRIKSFNAAACYGS